MLQLSASDSRASAQLLDVTRLPASGDCEELAKVAGNYMTRKDADGLQGVLGICEEKLGKMFTVLLAQQLLQDDDDGRGRETVKRGGLLGGVTTTSPGTRCSNPTSLMKKIRSSDDAVWRQLSRHTDSYPQKTFVLLRTHVGDTTGTIGTDTRQLVPESSQLQPASILETAIHFHHVVDNPGLALKISEMLLLVAAIARKLVNLQVEEDTATQERDRAGSPSRVKGSDQQGPRCVEGVLRNTRIAEGAVRQSIVLTDFLQAFLHRAERSAYLQEADPAIMRATRSTNNNKGKTDSNTSTSSCSLSISACSPARRGIGGSSPTSGRKNIASDPPTKTTSQPPWQTPEFRNTVANLFCSAHCMLACEETAAVHGVFACAARDLTKAFRKCVLSQFAAAGLAFEEDLLARIEKQQQKEREEEGKKIRVAKLQEKMQKKKKLVSVLQKLEKDARENVEGVKLAAAEKLKRAALLTKVLCKLKLDAGGGGDGLGASKDANNTTIAPPGEQDQDETSPPTLLRTSKDNIVFDKELLAEVVQSDPLGEKLGGRADEKIEADPGAAEALEDDEFDDVHVDFDGLLSAEGLTALFNDVQRHFSSLDVDDIDFSGEEDASGTGNAESVLFDDDEGDKNKNLTRKKSVSRANSKAFLKTKPAPDPTDPWIKIGKFFDLAGVGDPRIGLIELKKELQSCFDEVKETLENADCLATQVEIVARRLLSLKTMKVETGTGVAKTSVIKKDGSSSPGSSPTFSRSPNNHRLTALPKSLMQEAHLRHTRMIRDTVARLLGEMGALFEKTVEKQETYLTNYARKFEKKIQRMERESGVHYKVKVETSV
ncbi:unnamed protein product [Amoebophrya sp. A120]|nr:unnamed protein product [Amoebophrya sp. A120]|eukprot:GSA120T00011991001.1